VDWRCEPGGADNVLPPDLELLLRDCPEMVATLCSALEHWIDALRQAEPDNYRVEKLFSAAFAERLAVLIFCNDAIDDIERAPSLVALAVMSAKFRNDGRPDSAPVAGFLDAAAAALRADPEEVPKNVH
jgi:hypothetical protein